MLTYPQAHIRFRNAWVHQGRSLDKIPFHAVGGVWGSWMGLFLCGIILAAQIFVAIAPYNESGVGDAENFFMQCLALPVVLFFWICGYAWKRTGWRSLDQIDLDTGLREHDWDEINAYRAKVKAWPAWRRYLHMIM